MLASQVLMGQERGSTVLATDGLGDEHAVSFEDQIASARYYLPVYGAGAEHADEAQDREVAAADNLEMWKAVEARQTEGMAGERDAGMAFDSIQASLGMDDEEFREFLAESLGDMSGDIERLAGVQPLYGELASLCGGAGAVSIYATGDAGAPPALRQYETVRSVPDRPDGVLAAWRLSDPWGLNVDGDVSAYAWQPADMPEILVVASAGESCGLPDLVEQISIERGE